MADLGPKIFDFLVLLALFNAFLAHLDHLTKLQVYSDDLGPKIFDFLVFLIDFWHFWTILQIYKCILTIWE